MRAWKILVLFLLILIILLFGGILVLRVLGSRGMAEPPFSAVPTKEPPALTSLNGPSFQTDNAQQARLDQAYAQVWAYAPEGSCQVTGETAQQQLSLTVLDADALAGTGLREALLERLNQRVILARRAAEIYSEDGSYRQELLQEDYETLLEERLTHPQDYLIHISVTLQYYDTESGWELQNLEELYPLRPDSDALFAAATEALPYLPLHYAIEEQALCGPEPDESKFVLTEDPAVIAALLETPDAKRLIGEQTLVWNPDISLIPGTLLRCYLDESILCIVWQEEEALGVGTFSEIFIADGSQLRRKISSDEPWSLWFEKTSDFARKANAVLAVGGDFYYHDRSCGISVYNREIIRFRPDNADTCFITADGDMLFRYRGDETSREETEQFLRDNDVLFSLAFGPVLIDDGVDVTPDFYPWGEINDYYARSALGLLGRHHYLTMNLNCGKGEYDHLPSLRHAADAMVARGCYKAYTLDGGQTASTAFHYELINPVQFGWEKPISDVIYFATAVPVE